jgi:hypothetical protein
MNHVGIGLDVVDDSGNRGARVAAHRIEVAERSGFGKRNEHGAARPEDRVKPLERAVAERHRDRIVVRPPHRTAP